MPAVLELDGLLVDNPDLPIDSDWDEDIGQDSRVLGWYVADTSFVTLTAEATPEISAWLDRSAKGKNIAQAFDTRQPIWRTNQINGLPALEFNRGAATDERDILSPPLTLPIGENPVSFGIVLNPGAASGSTEIVMGQGSSGTNKIAINKSTGGLLSVTVVPATGATLSVSLGAISTWKKLLVAFRPSTVAVPAARLSLSLDGGVTWTESTAGAGVTHQLPAGTINMGGLLASSGAGSSPWGGYLAEALFAAGDFRAADADLAALVAEYHHARYNL